MANPESRGLPVTRLSLLTHLSEVGTVATQVRMRGMKLSELSPSHLQKIQAESQHAPSVWSPVWGLQTLTSSLRHERGISRPWGWEILTRGRGKVSCSPTWLETH